jgi:hypothetical protein
VSRIFSPQNTNFPSPCIQRNLPATVRNFDLLRFRYSRVHCATKWEEGSATPARKSVRCLQLKNHILLERTCQGADAVRWIKRPAELRVTCLTDKTIYGYQAKHKTGAFQTRTVQAGQPKLLPAGAVNIFKPRLEAPSGSNQAPVQSYNMSETSRSKRMKLTIRFHLVTMLISRRDGRSLRISDQFAVNNHENFTCTRQVRK